MRLCFDERTEAFRREFAAWLDENAPDEATALSERSRSSAHVPAWARAWQRRLFDAGWLVPGDPPEHGGRDASLLEVFVHQEELGRRRIYPSYNPQGLTIIAPSILAFGTDEQKRAFVRTDPDAPKHQGLSCLLIPTASPGVTRRPFGSIVSPDDLDFNEVFFDDVEVPAENLIGQLHQGWRVATGSLGHERAMLWLGMAERLDHLVQHGGGTLAARGLADDPLVLDWFGELVVDAWALRLLGYRTLAKARRGVEATEQSILKLMGSEAAQQATLRVLEALGPDGLDPDRPSAPLDPLHHESYTASWWERYLRSFAGTIAGGTSQIQRNIIAERVLGLPR